MTGAFFASLFALTCLAAEPDNVADGPIKAVDVPHDALTIEKLIPAGSPPLALDGYCPVTLLTRSLWRPGDLHFGAVHRGRTYLFRTKEEQRLFLKDPDKFSPLFSGLDPYFMVAAKVAIEGERKYGVFFNQRVILFVSPESRDKFLSDPKHYADAAEEYFVAALKAAQ